MNYNNKFKEKKNSFFNFCKLLPFLISFFCVVAPAFILPPSAKLWRGVVSMATAFYFIRDCELIFERYRFESEPFLFQCLQIHLRVWFLLDPADQKTLDHF